MSENSSKKENLFNELVENATNRTKIDPKYYERYNVKRGLRNDDGTGVLVGLTEVGEVFSYIMDDAERVPTEGRLFYRGIEINDLVNGFYQEKRYGYEECVYLLLFGELPNSDQLYQFEELLTEYRQLPASFTEDMIMKAPSPDIMNKLARTYLALYSYDSDPDSTNIKNVLRQCISLIAVTPLLISYAYMAKRYYVDKQSLFIHTPKPEYNTAQNIL
ncbi:MAG: citrate/2-methylcitrate synthase, partial [Saccharofermentanales bacterium]